MLEPFVLSRDPLPRIIENRKAHRMVPQDGRNSIPILGAHSHHFEPIAEVAVKFLQHIEVV